MTTTAFAFGSPPTQGGQLSERGIKLVHNIISCCGAVAQLGERRVRNAKVGSSILLGSTNSYLLHQLFTKVTTLLAALTSLPM